MLPILIGFTLESLLSHVLLYVLALAVVAFIAWNGWRGAGGTSPGEEPPTVMARAVRAALFGGAAAAIAWHGLRYALPPSAIPGGEGQGLFLPTYGVLLGAGFLSAILVSAWLVEREWSRPEWVGGERVDTEGPRRREQIFDLAVWVVAGGLVGSRLLFILVNWRDYAKDWTQVFSLSGGLVFYGGLLGAMGLSFLFAWRHGINPWRLGDVLMPTVSLGQFLGRLGCFSAGCCWGDVTGPGSRMAVHFPGEALTKDLFGQWVRTPSLAFVSQQQDSRYVVEATGELLHHAAPGAVKISEWVTAHGTTLPVHPTQLYESLGQLVLFVTLLYLRRFRRGHGQIFGLWLMGYAVLRATVELFRGDVERGTLHGLLSSLGARSLAEAVPLEAWYNISTSQFISLCLFACGTSLLVWSLRAHTLKPSGAPATSAQQAA